MGRSGELVSKGIVMMSEDYYRSTGFLFTGLNKIKPEMIAEATARRDRAFFPLKIGIEIRLIRKK
jgi:hypothetical protein